MRVFHREIYTGSDEPGTGTRTLGGIGEVRTHLCAQHNTAPTNTAAFKRKHTRKDETASVPVIGKEETPGSIARRARPRASSRSKC